MPSQARALMERALARLDAVGHGGSPAACYLQSALVDLGQAAGPEEVAELAAQLWHSPGEMPARGCTPWPTRG